MAISSVTVKQLRFFVHVVDAGSISQAARELNVAQTALGLQVRKLEEILDTQLLLREPSGIRPTDAGRFVCERGRQIVQGVDSLSDEVRTFAADEVREVQIGMAPSLLHGVGAQAVLREREALPGIHLHLVEGARERLISGLETGEFQFIFTHDLVSDGTIRAVPVLRQPLGLVTAPGAAGAAPDVTLAEALQTDIIVRGETAHAVDIVSKAAADLGLKPNFAFEIDSLSVMSQVIRQFDATTIVTTDLVADEVARGELEVRRIVDPPLELTLAFGMRAADPPGRADFLLLGFLDSLIDEFCRTVHGEERRLAHLTSLAVPDFPSAAQ